MLDGWLKWVRYSLPHSHLGGKFSVQLDGCTLGEWPAQSYLVVHMLRFCFLAFCELVRVVSWVPSRPFDGDLLCSNDPCSLITCSLFMQVKYVFII